MHSVKQEHSNGCVLGAVASILDLTYTEVLTAWEYFNGDYKNRGIPTEELIRFLQDLGITYVQYTTYALIRGRQYIMAVPSLNNPGGLHQVAIKILEEFEETPENKGYILYDPSTLITHKELVGFSDVIEIIPNDYHFDWIKNV